MATEVVADDDAETKPKPSYFSTDLKVRTDFINNIYGSFQCVPTQELCSKSMQLICPTNTKLNLLNSRQEYSDLSGH